MAIEGLLADPADALMEQFVMTGELRDIAEAEIVFESVTEDTKLKRELIKELESVVSANCILATNTSAIPVSLLQEDAQHPERILAVHWDDPAYVKRFLEIVRFLPDNGLAANPPTWISFRKAHFSLKWLLVFSMAIPQSPVSLRSCGGKKRRHKKVHIPSESVAPSPHDLGIPKLASTGPPYTWEVSTAHEKTSPWYQPRVETDCGWLRRVLATGGWWLHQRRCAECGHIGCCETSPSQHAQRHSVETGHRVVASFEPLQGWFYDYEKQRVFRGIKLLPPRFHPEDQPVPGPAGRVPEDWESLLNDVA